MSGYQFVHLQTFCRKPNPKGQCVAQVFGELTRRPNFAMHVANPKPPELVDGLTANELIAAHDDMVATAVSTVTKGGITRTRALRTDRHTLMTAVASYPTSWPEIGENLEKRHDLDLWIDANIRYFRAFFGPAYRATFRHSDEAYPHLHIYALPTDVPGCDANRLHVGKCAKREAETRALEAGATKKEAVDAGNKALKARMREFQDEYFLAVGEPCGLLRSGPLRARLSRADLQLEKAAAERKKRSRLEADRAKVDTKLTAARSDGERAAEARRAWEARQDRTRADLRTEILAELEEDRARLLEKEARLEKLRDGLDEVIETEVRKRVGPAVHAAVSACFQALLGIFDGETRFDDKTRKWHLPERTGTAVAPFWKTLVGPAVVRLARNWARMNKAIASIDREIRHADATGMSPSELQTKQASLRSVEATRDKIRADMSDFVHQLPGSVDTPLEGPNA